MLFAGSELGHNILGRKAALMRYDGDAIRAFTGRTHTTDQMVFSSIGNFSAKTAETVATRYFAQQAAHDAQIRPGRDPPPAAVRRPS